MKANKMSEKMESALRAVEAANGKEDVKLPMRTVNALLDRQLVRWLLVSELAWMVGYGKGYGKDDKEVLRKCVKEVWEREGLVEGVLITYEKHWKLVDMCEKCINGERGE